MSKRREYATVKEHILGQSRAALIFVLASAVVFGIILLVLSPLTPELMMMLGIRASLDKLNIGDSGISDYYAFYKPAGLARNFAVSYVPGAADSYRVILDYLMFLNRSHGVTLALVDIPPEAAELLNAYVTVGDTDDDDVFDAYRRSVAGSEYASDGFRSFADGVIELNYSLTPECKIEFGSVRQSDTSSYEECAADGGSLLILSRYASHSDDGIFSKIESSDMQREYKPMLTDILYVGTPVHNGETRTDIKLPFVSGGVYTASRTGLDAIGDYRDFTLRSTSNADAGKPGGLVDFVSEYFFIIVTATDPDAESTSALTDEMSDEMTDDTVTDVASTTEITVNDTVTDEFTDGDDVTDITATDTTLTDADVTGDGDVAGTAADSQ